MTGIPEQDWSIVLGPPGTGKTTHLMGRVRQALSTGVPPDKIAFVTFTRRAAEEAQSRAAEEFGLSKSELPHFRTLHSLCMRATGVAGGIVLEGEKLRAFADWIGEPIEGRVAQDGDWRGYARGDRMLFMDGLARIKRVPLRKLYDRDHDDLDWDLVDRFSRGLSEWKSENGLHDFTDMLELFVRQGSRIALDHLYVDEAQDLSLLQWDVVRALAANTSEEVSISGDDDQAIFVWAGADVDTLIDHPGRATVLGQSWRVPRRVQQVAQSVIDRVRHRRPKAWSARDDDGVVTYLQRIEDADFSGDSVMVLSRNRHQLQSVESELRASGVLYAREGLPSVSRKTLQAIVTWERLRRGEPQRVADVVVTYELMQVGTGVQRGHKKLPGFHPEDLVGIHDLRERGGLLRDDVWSLAMDRLGDEERAYLIRCRRRGERLTRPPRINLSTIHGSKGGEANRVVLITDLAPRTWREAHADPDSENRVLYVAATRARQELCIVSPRTPRHYDV